MIRDPGANKYYVRRAFVGFAGFGGVDLVLREAGIDVIGIEIDDSIAQVNRDNGGDVLTADILSVNPRDYQGYDLAHFSPPCPNFSEAKTNGGETLEDIALGEWIARFVGDVQPAFFTLENAWAYHKSRSWGLILNALLRQGYGVDWWLLNAADYGAPQTRKRMIAIARRDGQTPNRPQPTHRKPDEENGQLSLVDQLPAWRGWYEAIEDLLPALQKTQPAPWQIKSMPCLKTKRIFIVGGRYQGPYDEGNRIVQNRDKDSPIWTVTASENGDTRVYADGQWLSVNPRCLARFQDFPDWFILPDDKKLAVRGLGNAVPPGLYRAILKSIGGLNE